MGFYAINHPPHCTPGWSSQRVVILSGIDVVELTSRINGLLANDTFYVLAISEATTTATFVDDPFIATVVFQEKIDPLSGSHS